MSWASELAGNRGSRCARIVRDKLPPAIVFWRRGRVAAAPIALVRVCAKADQLLMAGRILRGVPLDEAVVRPTTRFVEIKTESQVDLQALHRVRDRIVSNRTQLICQMRAFCLEYGIAMRQGAGVFKIDTMMNALLGPDSPPIGNPDGKKGTGWRLLPQSWRGTNKKVGPTLQEPTG